jgi:hypothetical protein
MSIRCLARVVSVVSIGLFTVVGSGLMALPARAAGTTTLHFYSVQQTFTATNAAGTRISKITTVGDRYVSTDRNYVGNHKHHASRSSASDHLDCVIVSATTQTCIVRYAIGASTLLGNGTVSAVGPPTAPIVVPINAGTGKYKNARGTVISTGIASSNNSDNTITLTR